MLSQLSRPTFFNINIFTADLWSNYSLTVLLGLSFLLLFFILYNFIELDLKKEHSLLGFFAVCYLPFAWAFYANTTKTINENLNHSESQNLIQNLCQMDKAQNLGSIYCSAGQYLVYIKANIPTGSKIYNLFNPGLANLPYYYLHGDYQTVRDIAQADYLIVYLPDQKVVLSEGGELTVITPGADPLRYGLWKGVAYFNDGIMILQRL